MHIAIKSASWWKNNGAETTTFSSTKWNTFKIKRILHQAKAKKPPSVDVLPNIITEIELVVILKYTMICISHVNEA